MARSCVIIGETGTGKSSSLDKLKKEYIGLDPKETIVINVAGKPLPFPKSKAKYNGLISQGGNYISLSDGAEILKILMFINKNRPEIKNIVIDDFQYIMADEFMLKVKKKGYDKFNEIAKHAYDIINYAKIMRDDINFIILTHSEYDEKTGSYRMKTIGKMLNDKVTLEGLFTVALYTRVEFDPKTSISSYYFITNRFVDEHGNKIPAKSPFGMFEELMIPNDLGVVIEKAKEYYD